MSMTKQHFNALAKMLVDLRPARIMIEAQTSEGNLWLLTVDKIADVCQHFNSNFNRKEFKKACFK